MRDIGKNIRTLREKKGMTQEELAQALFVTRQTVSNYETGRSRPDILRCWSGSPRRWRLM